MNYSFLVVIIMALVACDTVPTHSEKPLHLNILAKHNSKPYPQIDSQLGEELHENEKELAYEIAHEIMNTVDRYYQQYHMAFRDAHPKENGCVKAEFHTYKGLDHSLAKGIFADGQAYKALIRFSNSNEKPKGNDHDPDARGMAIKLTHQIENENGLTKEKILKKEQDFIMINHPVFILDDPTDYLSLVQAQDSASSLDKLFKIPFALGFRGMWNAYHTIYQDQVLNPLQTQYYSMVPYRLGKENDPERRAIKFSAKPYHLSSPDSNRFPGVASSCVVSKSPEPQEQDKNYLRTALRETLKNGDACMEFLVQEGTKDMSVENSQVEWEEKGISKFKTVALIKIPKQPLGEWKESACEDQSFDPWHAGEEHRPLGVVNRLRKVIYPIVSDYRRCLNYPDTEGCNGHIDSER